MNKSTTLVLVFTFLLTLISCRNEKSKQSELTDSKMDTAATIAPSKAIETAPRTIEEIQAAYNSIMRMAQAASLDSLSFQYSCNGEKNGSVTYFSRSGNLQMIIHRYHEYDHFSATDRYFVNDTTLFFAYRRSVAWSFESGAEGATKDNVTEQRIYLVDNKPIECLAKKYAIRSHAHDNPQPENVPNTPSDCSGSEKITAPYHMLLKYRNKPAAGCLN